ncbi:unnamed protein product [Orchesella dallaii]|uniref:U1 small nuclear ribonucleoprotein 70 kDa n=1 Tax=Orchesella dallaii TaxID=48710 RepID=A0ABP1Q7E9_9HEXA
MTQFLPPNLLALFAARDPIPYIPPVAKLSHEKPDRFYSGIGQYLHLFEDPSETPPKQKAETRDERMERKRKEKAEQVAYKLEQEIAMWNPHETASTLDPYRTLFIGRINYDTSESKLRREMESYGPIKKIVMVYNKKSGKPRGYAFVEYEHERDMHSAYKHADGKKIDGRRVVVDVERGRTVKGWLPRRLGGGLGRTRRGGPEVNVKISGRDEPDRDRFRDDKSERGGRDRERKERSRSKERVRDESRHKEKKVEKERRRSRDREKDRDREDRDAKRDKDKDRKRKRSRSRSRDRRDKDKEQPEEGERVERRKRSRSRDNKKKRRSKSRDNEKKKDRRDKDRDREHRREKDRNKDKDKEFDLSRVKVKEEPIDDYAYEHLDGFGGYMKPEKDMDGAHMHDYDDGYAAY